MLTRSRSDALLAAGGLSERGGGDRVENMDDKQLLMNCWEICIEELKQAAHIVVDVGRLNDTLIELKKRLTAMGVTREFLDK